jgi:hypothetical protein
MMGSEVHGGGSPDSLRILTSSRSRTQWTIASLAFIGSVPTQATASLPDTIDALLLYGA